MNLPNHFMIIPSLSCQASCSYCFGPHEGKIMDSDTLYSIIHYIERFLKQNPPQSRIKITFHGGEPLMAGIAFWMKALPLIDNILGKYQPKLAIQSNLWLADSNHLSLFKEYNVHLGTSLDGPEYINDAQRGKGYFQRTYSGIQKALKYGFTPGCIVTFSSKNHPYWKEIMDFFQHEKIGVSIHAATKGITHKEDRLSISRKDFGDLLINLVDYGIQNEGISISTIEEMCASVYGKEPTSCYFKNCFGLFLVFDPNGDIFLCQRFAGNTKFSIGNIKNNPSFSDFLRSSVAKRFIEIEKYKEKECADCNHFYYCHGGCTYNSWLNINKPDKTSRDPYCSSYKMVYNHIQSRLIDEMTSPENIKNISQNHVLSNHLLLKSGPITAIVNKRESIKISSNRIAKRIIAAYLLGKYDEIENVGQRLVELKIAKNTSSARQSLENLENLIFNRVQHLNNIYLYTNYHCQLKCTHCYVPELNQLKDYEMSARDITKLIKEANVAGFRQAIILGGEVTIHSGFEDILDSLLNLRKNIYPLKLVLRSNFLSINDRIIEKMAEAFDQIVVSVDGERNTHDSRRGTGTYVRTLRNVSKYQKRFGTKNDKATLSIASTLNAKQIKGRDGQHVINLSKKYNIVRIRFRPVLPLGRALNNNNLTEIETPASHILPIERIRKGFLPSATCGLGKNLLIEPDGNTFPCYAIHSEADSLGNVIKTSINSILASDKFKNLLLQNVDSKSECNGCDVRYICGGACAAWHINGHLQGNILKKYDCKSLQGQALKLLEEAASLLSIDPKQVLL